MNFIYVIRMRAPPFDAVVATAVSLATAVCDQVVTVQHVDDIDEVHQLDPVHQVDHKDEHLGRPRGELLLFFLRNHHILCPCGHDPHFFIDFH